MSDSEGIPVQVRPARPCETHNDPECFCRGMCPGGNRCVRGPEPHLWSADCEMDEGWVDL